MGTETFSPGQIIMAVFLPAFVLIAFGKSYRVRENTGRDPICLRRDKTGPLLAVEIGLTVSLILLLIASLLYVFYPQALQATGRIPVYIDGWNPVFALTVLVLSLLLLVRAAIDSGDTWRIGIDTGSNVAPAASGVYSWIRRPLDLSLFLAGFGLFVLVPTRTSLAVLVLLMVFLYLEGVSEERWWTEEAGEPYQKYLSATGRYFPRLTSRPRSDSTRR